MISTILFLSFTSSTATSAKPPAFARCASWLMLLASPASLRRVSASCLFSRGVTCAATTACRTYSLTRIPASPARADHPSLLVYPALCRTTARFVPCICHTFLSLEVVLKIATDGSGFPFAGAKQGSFGLPKHNLASLENRCPAGSLASLRRA